MKRLQTILPPPARQSFLTVCEELLLAPTSRIRFDATRQWTKQFSLNAGIYAVFEFDEIAYVGESGSLRGRMDDLLDSRRHVLRRSLGAERFSGLDGFAKASTSAKFPSHIEARLIEHMIGSLTVTAIELPFGRKEVEEFMVDRHEPPFNRKGQRRGVVRSASAQ